MMPVFISARCIGLQEFLVNIAGVPCYHMNLTAIQGLIFRSISTPLAPSLKPLAMGWVIVEFQIFLHNSIISVQVEEI